LAPSFAQDTAQDLPIPVAAPVIIPTLFFSQQTT